MKRTLAVLGCLLLAGVALAQKAAPSAEYVSDEGGYRVTFPPKTSHWTTADLSKTVATVAGNLEVKTTKGEVGGVVYSVTFTDYPSPFNDVTAKTLLDGVVRGMKGTDGKAVESDIKLDGVEGRQVTITAREERRGGRENEVRARVFLSGRRLVVVLACGDREAMKTKGADEFLGSFAWK